MNAARNLVAWMLDVDDPDPDDEVAFDPDRGLLGHAADFDRLDLRVFVQDRWWVDRAGVAHRIDEMPSTYRRNVLAFCRDMAGQYHSGAALAEFLELTVGEFAALRDLDVALVAETDPVAWLESTPLIRRLRAVEGLTVGDWPDPTPRPHE